MTDFKWLRDIGAGRTRGPWKTHRRNEISDIIGIYEHYLAMSCAHKDARFIAAAGTLWDKIVAVVEAAEKVRRMPRIALPGLRKSLDDLQAARKEVE